MDLSFSEDEVLLMQSCNLCPRNCNADRSGGSKGYCGADAGLNIASVCLHRGEEPGISGHEGICNVFFAGCNLRCIYCQNHDISDIRNMRQLSYFSMEEVLDSIGSILLTGIKTVGFVSPSHMIPQMKLVIRGLHSRGLKPVIVYNTGGYDKPEVIDSLDGLIDIYLPDYKYVSPELAKKYSGAADYPEIVLKALKRMYYQKGSVLLTDDRGRAEKGLLIRHLVLPGHAEESKKVLRSIAEELSPGISLSLMSQYHPSYNVRGMSHLGRSLQWEEYESVVHEMELLGFRNGWLQDTESSNNYRPDFSKKQPFE